MHNSYIVQIKLLLEHTKLCLKNYPFVDIKMLERIQTNLRKSLNRLDRIRSRQSLKRAIHTKECVIIDQDKPIEKSQRKTLSLEELNCLSALYKTQMESIQLILVALENKAVI